jgi:FlaA1/EpsC-like NDP-sugar epimerase
VLASRGSVIPLFHDQIASGGPVTITDEKMTRFLLSLNQAVDIVFEAMRSAKAGETYIPIVPTANVTDIAAVLIGNRPIKTLVTGIRPGEKLHEILISEEEARRAFKRGSYYVVPSMLPELQTDETYPAAIDREYSSEDDVMSREEVADLLKRYQLMVEDAAMTEEEELIR